MAQNGTTSRPAGTDQSLGELVAQASKDVSQLIRGEMNLAKVELKHDLRRIAVAVVLLGMSAFLACLILVLACFALAYFIMSEGIWGWASFLLVILGCVLLIAVAAVITWLRVRGVTGLRTTRASVHDTIAALRGGDQHPEIAGPTQR
jgi:uncharacterized membrane protein YqjE